MNWYKKIDYFKVMTKVSDESKKMVKFSWDYKNQETDNIELGDAMRYTMDSHDIKLTMNKTNDEIMISLTLGSAYVGTYILDCFWSFNISEENKARKLYKEISSEIKPILSKFIKERIPTSLLCPFLRKAVSELNKSDYIKTNIPVINYSYDIPLEDDWRETIYGKRYPSYKEESFEQYTNSSYYTNDQRIKGKFAL